MTKIKSLKKKKGLVALLSWSFKGVSTSGIAGFKIPDNVIGLSPCHLHQSILFVSAFL